MVSRGGSFLCPTGNSLPVSGDNMRYGKRTRVNKGSLGHDILKKYNHGKARRWDSQRYKTNLAKPFEGSRTGSKYASDVRDEIGSLQKSGALKKTKPATFQITKKGKNWLKKANER